MILDDKQVFYKNKEISEAYYNNKKVYENKKELMVGLKLRKVYGRQLICDMNIPDELKNKKFTWEIEINSEQREIVENVFHPINNENSLIRNDVLFFTSNGYSDAKSVITVSGKGETHKGDNNYMFFGGRLNYELDEEGTEELLEDLNFKFKITLID